MKPQTSIFTNFVKSEDGAAMLEYTVLLAIILVAAISAIVFAGGWAADAWAYLQTTLEAAPIPAAETPAPTP